MLCVPGFAFLYVLVYVLVRILVRILSWFVSCTSILYLMSCVCSNVIYMVNVALHTGLRANDVGCGAIILVNSYQVHDTWMHVYSYYVISCTCITVSSCCILCLFNAQREEARGRTMWSYKYTSAASVFVDQCRVGVRFEAATPTTQLVALSDAVTKEQVREKRPHQ